MEENKPFMPPPPPKMPPLPPRGQAPGQVPPQGSMEQPAQTQQAPVQNEENVAPNASEGSVSMPVDASASAENVQTEAVKSAEKKEPMTKEKKKNTLTTALYWGGFVLCLVGIALCIFFIVK